MFRTIVFRLRSPLVEGRDLVEGASVVVGHA